METNKCQFCGNELDEGGLFCGFCGAKLSNVKTISIIPPEKTQQSVKKRIFFGVMIGILLIGITIGILSIFVSKQNTADSSEQNYSADDSAEAEIIHPDASVLSVPGDSSFMIPDAVRSLINVQADPSDYLSGYSGYSATMTVLYSGVENAEWIMQTNEYTQEEITAFLEEYSRLQNFRAGGTVSLSSTSIEVLFADYQSDAVVVWNTDESVPEYEPGIYRTEKVTGHADGTTLFCKTICFLNDGSIFVQIGTSETTSDLQILSREIRILLTPFEEKRPEHHSVVQTNDAGDGTVDTGASSETTSLTDITSDSQSQNAPETSSEKNTEDTGTSVIEKETGTTASQNSENNVNTAYHTNEFPEKDEFAWYLNDVKSNGVWSDSVPVTDFNQLSGGWKGSIIYNQSETITMDCREDVNFEITGSASAVNAQIHWGVLYIEGEDTVDETYIEDTSMNGVFQNGSMTLTGPCDIQFTQFFTKNQKQYAIGSLSSSEGESAVVILVRP